MEESQDINSDIDELDKLTRDFLEFYEYKPEDAKRIITEEELKELCLRKKCVVRMSLWNPVDDFAVIFKRKGRLQNKTKKKQLSMLARCVEKYKPNCLYPEEQIRATKLKEWLERKRLHILTLDLWKYDRECAKRDAEPHNSQQIRTPVEEINQQFPEMEVIEITDSPEETENEQNIKFENMSEGTQSIVAGSQPPSQGTELLEFFVNGINTESMNLLNDTEIRAALFPSQEILSQETQDTEFGSRVPCSSTQQMNN